MADNKVASTVSPWSLDEFFSSSPIGSLDKAIGNNIYGINHQQTHGAVPSSKDAYGFTFIVRPQLNLQTDNIRNIRQFYGMLTNESLTIQHTTRCLLDPRIMAGYSTSKFTVPPLQSSIVDNENAFFAILANNIQSVSGWPDSTMPTWSSKPGLFKEVYSLPDGLVRNFGQFTLDCTFRNTVGSPIIYMMHIWQLYMQYVKLGTIVPYHDYNCTTTLDFNTRIYRLTLDQQKNTVTGLYATGWAYPISNSVGQFADFNKETPYNEQIKDITVRFQCHGFELLDDILVYEFNQTVAIFKRAMRDAVREQHMVKLTKLEKMYLKYRGYPRINPQTYELEWWVPKDLYAVYIGTVVRTEADFSDYESESGD